MVNIEEVSMLRIALFVFLASTLIAGFAACPAEQQAETPVVEEKPPEMEMTEEQKMEYVFANCVCAKCPSWTEECTKKGEKGGYCVIGKTECITKETGCTCPECPVTEKMGLKWGYYCTRGSAKDMMAMEAEKKGGE
jgi:hypothetical protein